MDPGTSEALKDGVRRALPLVVVLTLVGALALFGLRQWQGEEYEASADVLVSTTNVAAAIAGTQAPYVDPGRTIDNAVALARSGELYARVADETDEELGTATELRDATSVGASGSNDVITFTSRADDADRARDIVGAVADAYPEYRAEIALRDIDRALEQLRAQIEDAPDDAVLAEKREQLELLQTLLNSGDATVIDRAAEAVKVNPRPARDLVVGAALGFVLALLIAGAREALNTRVRSEAAVEELLDRPVLASIQTLPKRSRLVTLGGRHEARFSDTYALLAANLMQQRDGAGSTVLAVTSGYKGEGKTTTAANLAVAFARRGADVILADFDVRQPSLGEVFRVPGETPGVLQVVSGDAKVREVLFPVDVGVASRNGRRRLRRGDGQADAVESPANADGSLHVIHAGGSLRSGALARSPRARRLVEDLRQQADMVVLDTPPALLTAEMVELSALVDLILVVTRQGRITRRGLQTLNKQAQAWQAEVVGAVVTGTTAEERNTYYGG
jgi:Mrp family chromosome partitioning ATPase